MFKKEYLIWWVLLAALIIRVTALAHYGLGLTLHSDDEGYVRSAMELLKSGMLTYHSPTEPTVHIMPGQPLLLAAVFLIFGKGTAGLYAAKILMILIGAAGIYGIYLIAKSFGGIKVALVVACLFAVSVPHILTDTLTLTETPFATSFIFLIYFSIRLAQKQNMSNLYWLMFFYIAALMFRPTVALYPLLLFVYLLLKKYPIRLMLKQAAVAAVILLVVLTPWWIRNYSHYHQFIPLTGGSGNPLLLGTYQGQGYPNNETAQQLMDRLHYSSTDAFTINKVQQQAAKERIKTWWETDRKSFTLSYLYLKPKILWKDPFYWIEIFHVKTALLKPIHAVTVIAGIAGLLISLAVYSRHRKEILLILGSLIYFTILYSAYYVQDRYNEPLMPFLFLGIGLGGYSLAKRVFRRKGGLA